MQIKNFNILANKTSDNLVLCGDLENVLKIKSDKKSYYYGFKENNDLVAKNLELTSTGSSFDVYYKNSYFEHFNLKLFGRHMILYNVPKEIIKEVLDNFKGANRRFSETHVKNTIIIDDYAHHPTEIMATLDSARQKYPNKKIIGVFLPNTYSRTEALMEDFAKVLSKFDYSYVMDIKCDRERQEDYPNVSSDILISKIKNAKKLSIDKIEELDSYKNDVICFMSCANITPVINAFIDYLNK